MDDNKRLIEILTHILDTKKEIVNQVRSTNSLLEIINTHIGNIESEVVQIKDVGIKTNLMLQGMNQSLHQLNKKMAHFAEHENRIRKLEQICKIT